MVLEQFLVATVCPVGGESPHFCEDKGEIGYDVSEAIAEEVVDPQEPLRTLPDEIFDDEGAAVQSTASVLLCKGHVGGSSIPHKAD